MGAVHLRAQPGGKRVDPHRFQNRFDPQRARHHRVFEEVVA